MSETVLSAFNISKRFDLRRNTLQRPRFWDIARSMLGLSVPQEQEKESFYALRNVSFELRRGESLGIVGLNGAGKSTLLKIVLGRLSPDRGEVSSTGDVGGLVELGAGFHPEQTGRKNINLNAKLLGIGASEINQNISKIIEFSELGSFIDMPVKTYSSGMVIRLGFAIAIHFLKDVIVCDEILAVGDFEFRQKCYRKIHELKKSRSFILVSHGVNDVALFCDKALFLHKGESIMYGEVQKVLESYSKASQNLTAEQLRASIKSSSPQGTMSEPKSTDYNNLIGSTEFDQDEAVRINKFGPIFIDKNSISKVSVTTNARIVKGELQVDSSEEFEIIVEFENYADVSRLRVGLPFFNEKGEMVIGPDSRSCMSESIDCTSKGCKRFSFLFEKPPFINGRYFMAVAINNDPGFLYRNHIGWFNFSSSMGEFGHVRSNYLVTLIKN